MSFGFDVGDIVLAAQLAYRLYNTLATDNRPAVKELGNTLFGLRCALDHLSRQANEISGQTRSRGDQNAELMHGDLDTMIASCAATLTELDKLFAKYASKEEENDWSSPGVEKRAAILGAGNSFSLSKLKNTVKIGSMRLWWSKDSPLFIEYRQKLQSHADAINIVLTTFLWSASQLNAERVQQIRDQALESNAELFKLVNGIHATVSKTTAGAVPPAPAILNNPSPSPDPATGDGGMVVAVNLINSSQVNLPHRPARQPPNCGLTSRPSGTIVPHLSTDLLEINEARSVVGREQLLRFARNSHFQEAVPQPVPETDPGGFFRMEHPTVSQVEAELGRIVSNMSKVRRGEVTSNDLVTQQLHRWLQGVKAIIQPWLSSSAATKEEKQRRLKDGQELMLSLNTKISHASDSVKKQIYEALENEGIERTFEKLRNSLRSVMIEKEIQIYEDEREAFL